MKKLRKCKRIAMESDLSSTVGGVATTGTFSSRNEFAYSNRSANHVVDYDPIRDPLYIVIPISIIYVAIFVTGLLGNIVTCIVIARNRYMHTATNYYLFSLAISDLLLLVSGLPQEMVAIWYKYPYMFGEAFCILRGLSAETSTNASILTITAFTVERYFAICHPFMSQTMSKLSRAVKLIILVWLVSLSFALPQAMQFGLVSFDNNPKMVMCMLKRKIIKHSFELSTFLFFITPMTLITILYVLIGVKLRRSNVIKRNCGSFQKDSENGGMGRKGPSQSSRRVIKMLVAIVVAFFICWAPFHAQRLVYIYGSSEQHKHISPLMNVVYTVITYISGVLYYFSTTINPILYHIMSLKFREAFKDTIARCCGLPTVKNHRGRRYSVLQRGQPVQFSPHSSMHGGVTLSYDADLSSDLREESTTSTCMNMASEAGHSPNKRSRMRKKTMSASEATEEPTRIEMIHWTHRGPGSAAQGSLGVLSHPELPFLFHVKRAKKSLKRSKSNVSCSSLSFCSVFPCVGAEDTAKTSHCTEGASPTGMKPVGGEQRFPRTRSSSDSGIMRSRSFCDGFSSNVSNSSLRDYDQSELQEELSVHLADAFNKDKS